MTTIIWTEGMLLSDTRVKFLGVDGEVVKIADNLGKICTPADMTCNGDKVLAVAVAGNGFAIDLINEMDGQGVDLLDSAFYSGLQFSTSVQTNYIVITPKKNYGVLYNTDGTMQWVAQAKHHSFIAGSCFQQLIPLMNKMHPVALIAKAMEMDEDTGGLLGFWYPGGEVMHYDMAQTPIQKLVTKKYNWFTNHVRQFTNGLRTARQFRKVRKALA